MMPCILHIRGVNLPNAITLSRLAGMSHEEIAQMRGASVGSTRVLLHRALARLGTELAG